MDILAVPSVARTDHIPVARPVLQSMPACCVCSYSSSAAWPAIQSDFCRATNFAVYLPYQQNQLVIEIVLPPEAVLACSPNCFLGLMDDLMRQSLCAANLLSSWREMEAVREGLELRQTVR